MKKNVAKRFNPTIETEGIFKKPIGFCCGIEDLEPNPQYRRQDAPPVPFASSNVVTGPNVRLSVQERGRPISAGRPDRSASRKITLGECKRCSGPLQWYLEDEIAQARDMLASKKQKKYAMDMRRMIEIGKKKEENRLKSGTSAKEIRKSSED